MAEHLIESLDDPRLLPYRALKQSNLTRWSGSLIAEGIRVVERLLAGPVHVESVFISEAQRHRFPADLGERVEVFRCSQSLAELVVGYKFHAGVLACAKRPLNAELSTFTQAEQSRSVIVCCPNITDPDNLGSIVRIAAGLGAAGLLLGERCCDPWSRRSLRVSMGNALRLPIRESTDVLSDLLTLRDTHGCELVATTLNSQSRPLSQWTPPERMVLLLGNESEGLPLDIVQHSTAEVFIPMAAEVDSLNVSVAAGIFLYRALGEQGE